VPELRRLVLEQRPVSEQVWARALRAQDSVLGLEPLAREQLEPLLEPWVQARPAPPWAPVAVLQVEQQVLREVPLVALQDSQPRKQLDRVQSPVLYFLALACRRQMRAPSVLWGAFRSSGLLREL